MRLREAIIVSGKEVAACQLVGIGHSGKRRIPNHREENDYVIEP